MRHWDTKSGKNAIPIASLDATASLDAPCENRTNKLNPPSKKDVFIRFSDILTIGADIFRMAHVGNQPASKIEPAFLCAAVKRLLILTAVRERFLELTLTFTARAKFL